MRDVNLYSEVDCIDLDYPQAEYTDSDGDYSSIPLNFISNSFI